MLRFIAVLFPLALCSTTLGAPLPFEDGRYVVEPELCFWNDEQMMFAYTDRLGRLQRNIDGETLSDGYELSCQVSNVQRDGNKVTFTALCQTEGEEETIEGSYTFLSPNAFRLYGQSFRRCESGAAIPEYSDYLDADSGELLKLYADANGRCRGGS